MDNLPKYNYTRMMILYMPLLQSNLTKGLSEKSTKGCIILFVCFENKTVPIKKVNDLIADTIIAARLGVLHHIYSDNAPCLVQFCRKKIDCRIHCRSSWLFFAV